VPVPIFFHSFAWKESIVFARHSRHYLPVLAEASSEEAIAA
jgi:hypothetical protein